MAVLAAAVEEKKELIKLIKKKTKIFLIYKDIQKGAVAKSYVTNGLLIYD